MKLLRFEWNKWLHSKFLYVFMLCLLVFSMAFFLLQRMQVNRERELLENNMSQQLNNISSEINHYNQSLNDEDVRSLLSEEEIEEYEFRVSLLEHSQNALRGRYDAFTDNNNEEFLEYSLEYVQTEWMRTNETLDPPDEEDLIHNQSYYLYQEFHEREEAYELRTASMSRPFYLTLLFQSISHPFILSVFVLVISFLLFQSFEDGTFKFEIMETYSRKKWLLIKQALSYFIFIGGTVCLFLIGFFLILFTGETFIQDPSAASSLQAPYLLIQDTNQIISIGTYFLVLIGTLIVLYPFLLSIYFSLLTFIKSSIFSGLFFLVVTMAGFLSTQRFEGLQSWINPFQLFRLQEVLQTESVFTLVLSGLVTIGFTICFCLIGAYKIDRKPV